MVKVLLATNFATFDLDINSYKLVKFSTIFLQASTQSELEVMWASSGHYLIWSVLIDVWVREWNTWALESYVALQYMF